MHLNKVKDEIVAAGAMLALTMLLMVSCLPDPLEVKSIPGAERQIVVSSQIVPDQSLLVLLTSTFGALEGSENSNPQELLGFIAVNDASVTIEGLDRIDTLEFLGSGVYGGIVVPLQIGEEYRLSVHSPTLGSVFATTTVKRKVEFEDVDADLYYNGFDDTLAQITYNFADSDEENFYMINVQEVEREDMMENIISPSAFTLLFDDKDFNGHQYAERFRVAPRDYRPGDSIAVTLSNISEDYYRFMQLRIDNRFSFLEFVSEPVNYPSNIVGGKGFFNLYLPDVRFFVFD